MTRVGRFWRRTLLTRRCQQSLGNMQGLCTASEDPPVMSSTVLDAAPASASFGIFDAPRPGVMGAVSAADAPFRFVSWPGQHLDNWDGE